MWRRRSRKSPAAAQGLFYCLEKENQDARRIETGQHSEPFKQFEREDYNIGFRFFRRIM